MFSSFTSFFSKKVDFYEDYRQQLSSANDDGHLMMLYQSILDELQITAGEDESFQEKLIALNQAYKQRSNDIQQGIEQQWKIDFLKKMRACLVSDDVMFAAFEGFGNLKSAVTKEVLMDSLKKLTYEAQIPAGLLKCDTRPTTIRTVVHFYSISNDAYVYFEAAKLDLNTIGDSINDVHEAETNFFNELAGMATNELESLYDKYQGSKVNYLYNVILNNPSDVNAHALVSIASLTVDELDHLQNHLRGSSIHCKAELMQIVKDKITILSETNEAEVDTSVVIHKSKRLGGK